MVIMIYRMLAQDLMRFGIIYSMFIIGFSQAYYIIFQSFEVQNCINNKLQYILFLQESEDEDEGGNPLRNPTESFIQVECTYFSIYHYFENNF